MSNEKLKVIRGTDSVLSELNKIQLDIKELKAQETMLKLALISEYKSEYTAKLKAKSEPFGQSSFETAEYKVTFNTPKKVTWDQNGLAELHKEGAPVDVEYSVGEKTYKELNDAGKEAFMPYRTVTPGNVSVEIEVKE